MIVVEQVRSMYMSHWDIEGIKSFPHFNYQVLLFGAFSLFNTICKALLATEVKKVRGKTSLHLAPMKVR